MDNICHLEIVDPFENADWEFVVRECFSSDLHCDVVPSLSNGSISDSEGAIFVVGDFVVDKETLGGLHFHFDRISREMIATSKKARVKLNKLVRIIWQCI